MKLLGKVKPHREKTDGSAVAWGWEVLYEVAETTQVTLPGDRNVLQLDCADDCTTMSIYLNHWMCV